MKPLPRWVRLLLWLVGADYRELSEPAPMLLPVGSILPPPGAAVAERLGRAQLQAKLIDLDALCAVAGGGAQLNPLNGHVFRMTDRTWLS